jgi:hypothetical protein
MLRKLDAVPLTHETAQQIFPLAQSVMPDLALEAWLAFAHQRIGAPPSGGGIVGIRDARGYFHGLFDYRARRDLMDGTPTLDVGLATAIDLFDRFGAAFVLVRELEAIATKIGCIAIQVHLRPEQRRFRRWLEREGHGMDAIVMRKALAPTEA